jgi:hypothetical protein
MSHTTDRGVTGQPPVPNWEFQLSFSHVSFIILISK